MITRIKSGPTIGYVVIGANYGDEGKGLMTDYLASLHTGQATVVRFNGGAQAGHTVVTPDGRRHVFSHFGSGSFAGCPTHLSRHFIVNPLLFANELEALRRLGLHPSVTIDERALLTTPFDMFINQELELMRGVKRHGSCGLGINETVLRCMRNPALLTRAKDLLSPRQLADKIFYLQRNWLEQRMIEVGIDPFSQSAANFLDRQEQIIKAFLTDCTNLLNNATIENNSPRTEVVIFEGAQGLMLDEDRIDQWPNVTRSKTGLFNVVRLAQEWGLDALQVAYMSRTYLTRHGAGFLPGECALSFKDETNVPNQFQGRLRFAPLHLQQLTEAIDFDLRAARRHFPRIDPYMALTCADQTSPPPRQHLPLPLKFVAFGPTRLDIEATANRSGEKLQVC